VRAGVLVTDIRDFLLANVRGREEREGDLAAQLGALNVGHERLLEIVARYGWREADLYARHLFDYADRLMRRAIASIPDGVWRAVDYLDDDGEGSGPIAIAVTISVNGDQALVDFSGSSPQVAGPLNAVEAIAVSAVFYAFRCLIPGEAPASAGLLEAITVVAPSGTIVNASPPAPVAGGNVETSQRIVDTIFLALSQALPARIPAASQGSMNNLTIGGWDAARQREFAWYETIAGGMGARPGEDGLSAVHTHMTNSLNTPVEALEYSYPLIVRQYCLRRRSGGRGRWVGGDGIVREVELLTTARVSILSDRRTHPPYGLAGGASGLPGRNILTLPGAKPRRLPGKISFTAPRGTRLRIETPGGGGYGPDPEPPAE
jgi:N-methylhydantoinase B